MSHAPCSLKAKVTSYRLLQQFSWTTLLCSWHWLYFLLNSSFYSILFPTQFYSISYSNSYYKNLIPIQFYVLPFLFFEVYIYPLNSKIFHFLILVWPVLTHKISPLPWQDAPGTQFNSVMHSVVKNQKKEGRNKDSHTLGNNEASYLWMLFHWLPFLGVSY